MFWIKNKKIRYTPVNPSFDIKVGFKGGYISQTYFSDDKQIFVLRTWIQNTFTVDVNVTCKTIIICPKCVDETGPRHS